MNTLAIASIVEGHGDEKAVPLLLRRLFQELAGVPYVDVIRPIRIVRSKLVQDATLLKAVDLAELKLASTHCERKWIIIIFDADEDLACRLAPQLLSKLQEQRAHLDISIVLPVPEYETWFVAAAESLEKYLHIDDVTVPFNPEQTKTKKAWLQQRFRGRYTETIEQAALTSVMSLALCRERSASFDKLCREVEHRATEPQA